MAQLHASYKKTTLNIQPEKVKSKLIEKNTIFKKKKKKKNSGSSTNINIGFRTKYKESNCMMPRGSVYQKNKQPSCFCTILGVSVPNDKDS